MQEFKHVQGHWDKLKLKISKDVKLLEEITSKLRIFEVKWKDFFFLCNSDVWEPFLSLSSCRSPDDTDWEVKCRWALDWQRLEAYIVHLWQGSRGLLTFQGYYFIFWYNYFSLKISILLLSIPEAKVTLKSKVCQLCCWRLDPTRGWVPFIVVGVRCPVPY